MIVLGSIFGGGSKSSSDAIDQKMTRDYAGIRTSNKNPLQKMTDDFLMDIGSKPKDADYYARLDDRQRRSQEAVASMSRGGDRVPQVDTGPSQAELDLQKRREEGQKARTEFEKKKGKMVLAQRKKYTTMLNLS